MHRTIITIEIGYLYTIIPINDIVSIIIRGIHKFLSFIHLLLERVQLNCLLQSGDGSMIDLSFPKRGRRGGLSHPVGRQDTTPSLVFGRQDTTPSPVFSPVFSKRIGGGYAVSCDAGKLISAGRAGVCFADPCLCYCANSIAHSCSLSTSFDTYYIKYNSHYNAKNQISNEEIIC